MSVLAIVAPFAAINDAVTGAAGVPVALLIGMISFFTPCILPLVPGYLSYVSGFSAHELEEGAHRGRLLAATGLFVTGFAIAFTLLGASFGAASNLLWNHQVAFRRISGVIVIVMGLAFLSALAVKPFTRLASREEPGLARTAGRIGLKVSGFFAMERGLNVRPRGGMGGALPLGAAFAIAWTPCVGPGLGTILTLAANEPGPGRGALLLFSFSIGFGVWFILGAIGFRKAVGAFAAVRRHMSAFVLAGGLFMLTIGILMVLDVWQDLMAPLQIWFNRWAI